MRIPRLMAADLTRYPRVCSLVTAPAKELGDYMQLNEAHTAIHGCGADPVYAQSLFSSHSTCEGARDNIST